MKNSDRWNHFMVSAFHTRRRLTLVAVGVRGTGKGATRARLIQAQSEPISGCALAVAKTRARQSEPRWGMVPKIKPANVRRVFVVRDESKAWPSQVIKYWERAFCQAREIKLLNLSVVLLVASLNL